MAAAKRQSDLLRRHLFLGQNKDRAGGCSIKPIPVEHLHDPELGDDPGCGRRVVRRMNKLGSSPGDRLDRTGIG